MPQRNVKGTVIKLIVASLFVGMLISFFGVDPREFLEMLGHTAQEIFDIGVAFIRWSAEYILIGAVVVIPVWAVMKLPGLLKSRKRRDG